MTKHVALALCCAFAALTACARTFPWPTGLKYDFLPKRPMEFVDGVVRNTDSTAEPDIDAKYSRKVKVDGRTFELEFELCEATSACYRADLNGDGVPDYVFVDVEVWNGRFAGRSKVAVYVSGKGREFRHSFEAQYLEAVMEDGVPMLVRYEIRDDVTLTRTVLKFDASGEMRVHRTETIPKN